MAHKVVTCSTILMVQKVKFVLVVFLESTRFKIGCILRYFCGVVEGRALN